MSRLNPETKEREYRFAQGETLKRNRFGKESVKPIRFKEAKPGVNEPCICGSGKKYKKCHGGA